MVAGDVIMFTTRVPAIRECNGNVYVSGQIGLNDKYVLVDGITEQTRAAFQNVEYALDKLKLKIKKVVDLTVFLVNPEDYDEFLRVYEKTFVNPPALTCVFVSGLRLGALIEIKAVARMY